MEVIDPGDGLPTPPASAHTLASKQRPEPGRLHDASREPTPVIVDKPGQHDVSRWQTFAKVSAYHPTSITEGGRRVDEQWLVEHMPDLDAPWQAHHTAGDQEKGSGSPFSSHAKRRAWYVRLQVSPSYLCIGHTVFLIT